VAPEPAALKIADAASVAFAGLEVTANTEYVPAGKPAMVNEAGNGFPPPADGLEQAANATTMTNTAVPVIFHKASFAFMF
jgi:hypothetical protein